MGGGGFNSVVRLKLSQPSLAGVGAELGNMTVMDKPEFTNH